MEILEMIIQIVGYGALLILSITVICVCAVFYYYMFKAIPAIKDAEDVIEEIKSNKVYDKNKIN